MAPSRIRRLKNMLIDHYGDTICFSYPRDRTKSQMFYSTNITREEVAERLRSTDTIKVCADQLCDDLKRYEFELEETYNLAEDCHLSYLKFVMNRPQSWVKFFNTLFPYRTQSYPIQRKCDTIFQIFHYVMHQGQKHNPIHVSVAQLLHNDSRAKLVIGILNNLGISISYDELQRIDCNVTHRIIESAGSNRVPVSLPSNDEDDDVETHGAMDNFHHDE